MSAEAFEIAQEFVQGTPEWLALRKKKITATDANIIMRASRKKTRLQLYHEKLSDDPPKPPNKWMQRGLDLEPMARELFCIKTGFVMHPKVIVKDWTLASLDGISDCGKYIVEIKCPGETDHNVALLGKVPAHYYPQLQHQMYVAGVQFVYYFSFDGIDGVIVEVHRDNEYIEKMIAEEYKFYMCLNNETLPERSENDYIERDDEVWQECALKWKLLTESIKELEKEEEELRKELILLSGESNSKGAGISLCQVVRKGVVDYSTIECLKEVDLDKHRKEPTYSWRITCC